jgi:hypothetical protein
MQRAFSLKRYRSARRADIKKDAIAEEPEVESIAPAKSPGLYHTISKRILRRGNTRRQSYAYGDSKVKEKLDGTVFPHRTLTRREKIIHVIANPDTLFIHKEQPYSQRCESRYVNQAIHTVADEADSIRMIRRFYEPSLRLT